MIRAMPLVEVPVRSLPVERFKQVLGSDYADVVAAVSRVAQVFEGRVVWHVNSTARGGGVVELLQSLVAYARGAGADQRWVVIDGDTEFFAITKRIHNNLHGVAGDGGDLGDAEREHYERTLASSADSLSRRVREGDVVFLHDPQTAGMIEPVRARGAIAVWRCHVGLDLPNELARRAWDFLRPYVEQADAYVFSREEFAWEQLDRDRIWIVPPSIDIFSPKNQELAPEAVAAILSAAGIDGQQPDRAAAVFRRLDGSPGRVDRRAELIDSEHVPDGVQAVTQVSRWDRLKDPAGVITGFAERCGDGDAHLLLAGPSVAAVADDPEGAEVLEEVRALRRSLPGAVRDRTHLISLPMDDVEENAAIVNAIQRRSDIVVQKSLAEGFGLTVAEAMWKSRPVIASARGGIQDQIVDGVSGVLLEDPADLEAFGDVIVSLLEDPERAAALGAGARERVRERFLGSRHLIQYLDLLDGLITGG
jgi:trehalose synthase